jgi:hypothetical protein
MNKSCGRKMQPLTMIRHVFLDDLPYLAYGQGSRLADLTFNRVVTLGKVDSVQSPYDEKSALIL